MSAKTQVSDVSVKANAGASRRYAETKIKYTDEPLGKVHVIPDFLPSPAELAFREEGVKVTLALSKKSIEFFKSEATKHHTQYQRMIRRLLDAYVDAQDRTPAKSVAAKKQKGAARSGKAKATDYQQ
jgi:predicted DNA binding CopG/RHH family protein